MFAIVVSVISTILVGVCASRSPLSNPIVARSDLSLANFLLEHQARAATPGSMQCFNIYVPLLQQASTQWAEEYQQCLNVAERERNDTLAKASAAQKDASTTASDVCNYINACDAIDDALSALECFGLLPDNSISKIYRLSNNASDAVTEIREQIYIIDANSYKCCNASERTYVEATARIYDALDYCLKNGPPETVAPASPTAALVTPNDFRNIQLAAAPRRTPTGRILLKESKEDDNSPAPRSNLISVINNWLKNGREVVDSV